MFSRSRGLSPMDPDDAAKMAASHGWDVKEIPQYRGDYTAMMRAVDRVARSRELKKQGIKLEEVFCSKSAGEIVYGIVSCEVTGKDLVAMKQRLRHDHQFSVGWSKTSPSVVVGEHGIAQQVRDQLVRFRGKITGDDWQDAIRQYLLSDKCLGAKVRSDGRVYWCPPQRLDVVQQFGQFLSQLGIDLIIAAVQPEHVSVVQNIAADSLAESLEELELELAKFEATEPRRSTLQTRLETYASLRERANFYKSATRAGMEKSLQLLQTLEDKVNTMLSLTPTSRKAPLPPKTLPPPADMSALASAPLPQPQPLPPVPMSMQMPTPLPMPQPLPSISTPAPVLPAVMPVAPLVLPPPPMFMPPPAPPLVVDAKLQTLTSLAYAGLGFKKVLLVASAMEDSRMEQWEVPTKGLAVDIATQLISMKLADTIFKLASKSSLRFVIGDGKITLFLIIKDPLQDVAADLVKWNITTTIG